MYVGPSVDFMVILVWGLAGLAAGFVLPRVRPHLLYLAVYLFLCAAVIHTVSTLSQRGALSPAIVMPLVQWLQLLLPWAGIGLALWWRLHPQPAPGADPLWKRLVLFGGLAVVFLVLLIVDFVILMNVAYGMSIAIPSLAGRTLGFHWAAWLSTALVVAFLVPRPGQARLGVIIFSTAAFLLLVYHMMLFVYPPLFRMTAPFSIYWNMYYFFLPYLAIPLALLAKRKPGAGGS